MTVERPPPGADDACVPRGLLYQTEFISAAEEEQLLSQIDAGVWTDDIARRVQHHGYKYDYSNRRIDNDSNLGPLPAVALPADSVQRAAHRSHTTEPAWSRR